MHLRAHQNVLTVVAMTLALFSAARAATPNIKDNLTWLENRNGSRATAWVVAQNHRALAHFKTDPRFSQNLDIARSIHAEAPVADSTVTVIGHAVYRLVQSSAHPRGIWQRLDLSG